MAFRSGVRGLGLHSKGLAKAAVALPLSSTHLPLVRVSQKWTTPAQAHSLAVRAVAAPDRALQRTSSSKAAELERPRIGYELIQGTLVRWSESRTSRGGKPPPTCVLVHGILGSRKNMISFAHRIVEGFPSWQVLVVDLRCHGESANIGSLPGEPHNVQTSAGDVLALLRQMKLFPEVLVGHSFGGKVVMSMAEQFSNIATRLPRPVQVWVLDALPGEIRAGDAQRRDHPADLIARLLELKMPIASRSVLQTYLAGFGFSDHIAKWASTNLRAVDGDVRNLEWNFDLPGIAEMYRSYEAASLWSFLQRPADGIYVSFVRAEHSTFRWAGQLAVVIALEPWVLMAPESKAGVNAGQFETQDQEKIAALGHRIYFLHDAGHWVHTDNPEGLFAIIAPSFGIPDLQTRAGGYNQPALP